MKPIASRSLAKNTAATTTLEFALVSVVLIAMLLGGIEVGIMLWTRGTLQAIAAQTARCAALGSPLCNNASATPPLTPNLYAYNLAAALLGSGLVPASDITVAVGTKCINATVSGTSFEIVTIGSATWFGISPSAWFKSGFAPLAPRSTTANPQPDSVTACYPV
jgi:Flp pilus assembly protein TadG